MRIIDLTHPLADGQPSFPGDPAPRIDPHDTIARAGYNTARLSIGTHQGTHLDAPFHFFEEGPTVDQIPLERFFGPAVLVDLTPDDGVQIPISALERNAAAFQSGARVIYRTGWERQFGAAAFFTGYPSLTPEAAGWIADRGVWLLGMDTPSPAEDYAAVHRLLLGAGVVIVESLANLDALPERFTFAAFPLKLAGRDGSPVRAVAMVD